MSQVAAMHAGSISEVLENASKLPLDELSMVIEILRKRRGEAWRRQLARDIDSAEEDLHAGRLKAEPFDKLMERLHASLDEPDDAA